MTTLQVELEDPKDGSYREMPFTSGLGWTWSGERFDTANAKHFRCVPGRRLVALAAMCLLCVCTA